MPDQRRLSVSGPVSRRQAVSHARRRTRSRIQRSPASRAQGDQEVAEQDHDRGQESLAGGVGRRHRRDSGSVLAVHPQHPRIAGPRRGPDACFGHPDGPVGGGPAYGCPQIVVGDVAPCGVVVLRRRQHHRGHLMTLGPLRADLGAERGRDLAADRQGDGNDHESYEEQHPARRELDPVAGPP
jgi:hypothetical protein